MTFDLQIRSVDTRFFKCYIVANTVVDLLDFAAIESVLSATTCHLGTIYLPVLDTKHSFDDGDFGKVSRLTLFFCKHFVCFLIQ